MAEDIANGKPTRKKLVLDTNFLMIPEQVGVDIFEGIEDKCNFPYDLYTTNANIMELKKISKTGNMKDRTAANVAIGLIKAKNLKIVAVERDISADDFLAALPSDIYLVATADKELQKRLKKYIYLRQRKYIAIKD